MPLVPKTPSKCILKQAAGFSPDHSSTKYRFIYQIGHSAQTGLNARYILISVGLSLLALSIDDACNFALFLTFPASVRTAPSELCCSVDRRSESERRKRSAQSTCMANVIAGLSSLKAPFMQGFYGKRQPSSSHWWSEIRKNVFGHTCVEILHTYISGSLAVVADAMYVTSRVRNTKSVLISSSFH